MPTKILGSNVYPESFDIPSDGDPPTAASVNVGFEALADRTTYLMRHGLLGLYSWIFEKETPPLSFCQFTEIDYTAAPSGGFVDVPGAQAGNVVILFGSFITESYAWSPVHSQLRLAAIDDWGGAGSQASVQIPGARAFVPSTKDYSAISMTGHWVVQTPGTTRIRLEGRVSTKPTNFYVLSLATIHAFHLRLA